MAKTTKSQTSNSNPKTSRKITKITKAKQLVNAKVATRRSTRIQRSQLKFGELSFDLQTKIGWEIMQNFNLNEQLQLRKISSAWDYNFQLAFRQKVRSLVLHLTVDLGSNQVDNSSLNTFPYANFKRNIDENLKQSTETNKVEFTIKPEHLCEPSTYTSLGKLYCNVEQLTIYYTMNNRNFKFLCNLLQKFPKVTSFSLIVPNKISEYREYYSSQLFRAINNHLGPLKSLHLYFESWFTPKVGPNTLCKTLPFVQNLSLCFPIDNCHQIIAMMGKNLSPSSPIQSLSLRASDFTLSQIAPMFEQNPALGKIKRLQLVNVESREVVDALLDHFTELEYFDISIGSDLTDVNQYSVEWMKTLSKSTHLAELVLRGMHQKTFDFEVPLTPLSTVRRLTVDYHELWTQIYLDWIVTLENGHSETVEEFEQMMTDFLVSFAKQYPNLEELSIFEFFGGDRHGVFREMIFEYLPNLKSVKYSK